jgi:hypothetical protein
MFNHPVELGQFESWLKKKCAKITGRNDVQITVKSETYMLGKERNAVKPLSSETIASF